MSDENKGPRIPIIDFETCNEAITTVMQGVVTTIGLAMGASQRRIGVVILTVTEVEEADDGKVQGYLQSYANVNTDQAEAIARNFLDMSSKQTEHSALFADMPTSSKPN